MENLLCSPISDLLQRSCARHDHLCPRQVLGVRIGLAGLSVLGLTAPVDKGSALVISETDGCFADGLEVASGATIGHRTLRVNDLGKIAATFVDVRTGRAVRFAPAVDARQRAWQYASHEPRHYFAQLQAYQEMPDDELLCFRDVLLDPSLDALLSRPALRVICSICGEDVINGRHLIVDALPLCGTCAGQGYYHLPDHSPLSTRDLE